MEYYYFYLNRLNLELTYHTTEYFFDLSVNLPIRKESEYLNSLLDRFQYLVSTYKEVIEQIYEKHNAVFEPKCEFTTNSITKMRKLFECLLINSSNKTLPGGTNYWNSSNIQHLQKLVIDQVCDKMVLFTVENKQFTFLQLPKITIPKSTTVTRNGLFVTNSTEISSSENRHRTHTDIHESQKGHATPETLNNIFKKQNTIEEGRDILSDRESRSTRSDREPISTRSDREPRSTRSDRESRSTRSNRESGSTRSNRESGSTRSDREPRSNITENRNP
jgi:hypothetical protein